VVILLRAGAVYRSRFFIPLFFHNLFNQMIFDKISNSGKYKCLSPRLAKGLEYISVTDFSRMEAGKYELDGEALIAIVSEYETKSSGQCALEAHCKYLDIQYMLVGEEYVGLNFLHKQVPSKAYSDADDYALYTDSCSMVKLTAGHFAIFYPEDLHMPGVQIENPARIRKVIIKVLI
jgi:YhcH/YjgK/YiaL family protein